MKKPGRPHQRRFQKRKFCKFCVDKNLLIDYKDLRALRAYLTERGKIVAGRITGLCARHQRELTTAIKRARNIALLPFVER
ncbi:MAG: 30S ribosomal protein S18 [Nitrospirae bacterium]|nr:30S ribosomal protein S18 [Nitrospirota bacterium]